MEITLLQEIVIIFGLSIGIFFICHRLRLPSIVGFLITGTLAGPHGFGLIKAVHEVELLAEIGVVLLLFTIGIEFSLKSLLQIKKSVLLGGSLQVLVTILASFVIMRQFSWAANEAIFLGFLLSLSSTAIVLKLLQERAEVDSPHGRTALAILIFQDIAVVPMLLFTPLLAGRSGNLAQSLLILGAKGFAVILFVIVSAKWLVPRALFQIASLRSREFFLLSIVAICFAVALLTSSLGLSLALGAFLAGLIISESEYSHQAFGNIMPFRDLFSSFFFVSIGMLLDMRLIIQQPGLIFSIVIAIFILKAVIAGLAIAALGFPLRTMIIGGLALSQIAEFSFILSKAGVGFGLLSDSAYQLFLTVSVLTMVVSPFIISFSPRFADFVNRLPLPARLKSGFFTMQGNKNDLPRQQMKDHLLIIGFGLNGHNVARAARIAGIPYLALEMNVETVRAEQAKGEPVYYGDAIQEAVLEHANIKDARVMVIAISDPVATRRVTAIARQLNSKIHIIARTRFIQEMKPLYKLGAAEVIPEEFETSVEIFTRVLVKYLIPRHDIERFIKEIRSDGYEMFRSLSLTSQTFSDLKLDLSEVEISTLQIDQRSLLASRSLGELKLRKVYGVTILAIRRNGQLLSNPDGDTKILSGDILFALGEPDKIAQVASWGDEASPLL